MAGRTSVLAWDVPADREEPWRRLVQELSGPRHGEYAQSRRRLGISAESVWLAPRRSGGGVAVVCVESEDPDWTPERALRGFAASDDPFDSWYRARMGEIFGCEFARSPRVPGGEKLFGWRDAPEEAVRGDPEGS